MYATSGIDRRVVQKLRPLRLPAIGHLAFGDVDLDQLVDVRDIKLVPVHHQTFGGIQAFHPFGLDHLSIGRNLRDEPDTVLSVRFAGHVGNVEDIALAIEEHTFRRLEAAEGPHLIGDRRRCGSKNEHRQANASQGLHSHSSLFGNPPYGIGCDSAWSLLTSNLTILSLLSETTPKSLQRLRSGRSKGFSPYRGVVLLHGQSCACRCAVSAALVVSSPGSAPVNRTEVGHKYS